MLLWFIECTSSFFSYGNTTVAAAASQFELACPEQPFFTALCSAPNTTHFEEGWFLAEVFTGPAVCDVECCAVSGTSRIVVIKKPEGTKLRESEYMIT